MSLRDAESAESQSLRRDASLNRRSYDRQTGVTEHRDDSRSDYINALRDAGFDHDAEHLMASWEDELLD